MFSRYAKKMFEDSEFKVEDVVPAEQPNLFTEEDAEKYDEDDKTDMWTKFPDC